MNEWQRFFARLGSLPTSKRPEVLDASHLESPEKFPWHLFPTKHERRDMYEAFLALTHFVHDREVANMVFVDRSARPVYVGLRECWKREYPKEPRPGIYFMNTLGFMSLDRTPRELGYQGLRALGTGEEQIRREQPRIHAQVAADLQKQYKTLLVDKDLPLMVFDVCMHSGASVLPLLQTLHEAGCSKLLLGTMNEPPFECPLAPDFCYFPDGQGACHPFGPSSVVRKTIESVSSKRSLDPHAAQEGLNLRREIQALVTEQAQIAARRPRLRFEDRI